MKLNKRRDSGQILEQLGFESIDEFHDKFAEIIDYLKFGQASEEILRIILKRDRIRSMADFEEHLTRANHFRKTENKRPMRFQKLLIKAFQTEEIIQDFNDQIDEKVAQLEEFFGESLGEQNFSIGDLEIMPIEIQKRFEEQQRSILIETIQEYIQLIYEEL